MPTIVPKYSTQKISDILIKDITSAIQSVQSYGSVELYVQDGLVTQITTRTIKRTAEPKQTKKN